ncbi:MAG: DUF4124 domain-containing protein [Thiobacillus sp.]
MRPQTLLLCLFLVPTFAQAEIYKYVDENGEVTFTDVFKKGSKRIDLPGVPSSLSYGGGGKLQKRASYQPSPSNFPRIDAATQQRRDDIRRQVLQDEVSAERKNADEARRQLAIGERLQPGEKVSDSSYVNRVKKLRATISEHDQNVSSIQREINNLK